MRDIRDCSGSWKGTWTQRAVRGTMRAFWLQFVGDAIFGGGEDRDGAFTMQGETDGHAVYLLKSYAGLQIRYDGAWNGSYASGRSTIGPIGAGEFGAFEIWPEDEEESVAFSTEEAGTREPLLA